MWLSLLPTFTFCISSHCCCYLDKCSSSLTNLPFSILASFQHWNLAEWSFLKIFFVEIFRHADKVKYCPVETRAPITRNKAAVSTSLNHHLVVLTNWTFLYDFPPFLWVFFSLCSGLFLFSYTCLLFFFFIYRNIYPPKFPHIFIPYCLTYLFYLFKVSAFVECH